ncbi:MAG: CPBP family intramembrane glutamic endopeptidase [Polyangiales bacterium]
MGGYIKAALIALALPILNTFFMALAGFVQLKTVSVGVGEALVAAGQVPLNIALAQAASVGVLFLIAFPHRSREESFLETVHVKPLVGGLVALCFVLGVSLQFSFAEIYNLGQEIWPTSFDELSRRYRLLNPTTWWGGVSILLGLVLVAPVSEELVFRGWLLPMLKARYGTVAALLWSSILFGLVHREPSAIIYATLGGLILGVIALRTQSTLASIAVHAGVNATPLLLPVTVARIDGFNTLTEQVEHMNAWLVVGALAASAALLALIWRATEPPA